MIFLKETNVSGWGSLVNVKYEELQFTSRQRPGFVARNVILEDQHADS